MWRGRCCLKITALSGSHRLDLTRSDWPIGFRLGFFAPARKVAATIQANADAFGADLIVSGALGYTRLREWFFGSVTRSFLDHSPVCCLVSH